MCYYVRIVTLLFFYKLCWDAVGTIWQSQNPGLFKQNIFLPEVGRQIAYMIMLFGFENKKK